MVRRRPLLAFMILACGYSWGLWLLMIASARQWLPIHFPANFLGSFGPLIATCLLVRPTGVSPGVGGFFRLSLRPAPVRWLFVALIGPLALTVLAVTAHCLVAGSLPHFQAIDRVMFLPLVFILILLLGGPAGEEFGWRGYVLPLLLRRHHPLVASLFLAICWITWHLPLFWLEGAAQKGGSIPAFALSVAAASVLFTWLYLHTGPSLVPVLLFHTSINVWSFILPFTLPDVDASAAYEVALVSLLVLAALLVAVLDRRVRAGEQVIG